ncbi:MAG TPA: hypothetical protein VJW51_00265 [Candidatus Acidoferrales bacterium]|nr:hypothetical protein [Candidatus Acidoferrales bacterium]
MLPIFWAGAVCGTMDITAALVVYGSFGLKPVRLLQGIAAGLLGPRSYEGGLATALLGLFCHYFIAYSAATVYLAVSRAVPFLLQHAVVSGILYGPAVYFFMQYVVISLSATTRRPFSVRMMVIGVVIHIFCVGLPIALLVRRFSVQ